MSTLTSELCWIGGYFDSHNWKWVDGSDWSYTNWYPEQPDDSSNAITFNCVWADDGVGKWDDAFIANAFICQLKVDNSTTTSTQIATGKYINC